MPAPHGPKGLLQYVRGFTVQIRLIEAADPATWPIVGTGFLVSSDEIVTCAHVVKDAGVDPWKAKGDEVGVYIPRAATLTKAYRAYVDRCFAEFNDDVVILRLIDGPGPALGIEPAILGPPDDSDEREFSSYGFRRLAKYTAGRAFGTIMGEVDAPDTGKFVADPIQLSSEQINHGMSGAPVLEKARNLVVGVVSETWFTDQFGKDKDTAWAVSSKALIFEPFSLPLQEESHDLLPASTPPQDLLASSVTSLRHAHIGGNPPAELPGFVGRDHLIGTLTQRFREGGGGVTALVGFGGEGKSVLARHALGLALSEGGDQAPDGSFWWTFDRPSDVDAFLEQALRYTGGEDAARRFANAEARAAVIGLALAERRYVFVLDGLEAIQHHDGDNYSDLTSAAVLTLLTYFGSSERSLCIVTSRLPLLELDNHYGMYEELDLERLSLTEGRLLLRELGVRGTDAELDPLIDAWDGHALTLSLLGAYAGRELGGDSASIAAISPPTAGEPRSEHVSRVLQWYESRLSSDERSLLKLASVFRKPIPRQMFACAWQESASASALCTDGPAETASLAAMLQRLASYRIIRGSGENPRYAVHPLIRAHYYDQLKAAQEAASAHGVVMRCYASEAARAAEPRTLEDLSDWIEAVYHACRAGDVDEAFGIYCDRIDQQRGRLQYELGAYDTDLSLMLEFFPKGDVSEDPLLDDASSAIRLLRTAGLGFMTVGRLKEARGPFDMSYYRAKLAADWDSAARARQVRAELHIHLGELSRSKDAAQEAIALYEREPGEVRTGSVAREPWGVQNAALGARELTICALAYQGWAEHLAGRVESARTLFLRAESRLRARDPALLSLPDLWGIYYADHLLRAGDRDRCLEITQANLTYARETNVIEVVAQCRRLLGDIATAGAEDDAARAAYEESLRVARSISHRAVLIESLVALGRWQAKHAEEGALSTLNEALSYARLGGYRVYEADALLGLAQARLARQDGQALSTYVEAAERISSAIGYHWGRQEAAALMGGHSPESLTGETRPRGH